METSHILTFLLFAPIFGALVIAAVPEASARRCAIILATGMLALNVFAATQMNWATAELQLVDRTAWVRAPFPIQYNVGVDGLSMSLVLLTSVVVFLAIAASTSIKSRERLYYSFVMLLTFSLFGVFMSQDLLQFFVMYEFELVPMYFLIAIWGGPRRDYAAMKFLIYTFFGGVLMFGGLLYLYFSLLTPGAPSVGTFNMQELAGKAPNLPIGVQLMCFLGFFLAFIIKLPSWPFHTWLPDAHVEAPTPISMILAGLLLKMGSYGLVRICLGFFPHIIGEFGYLIVLLGAWNIVWAAVACLVQEDMKRIIAFSSVSHMGFILVGLGAVSTAALNGAIFQMISHGIISAALFFLVGVVYERTHTRLLPEIGGGLAKYMPAVFYFWTFAALANLGLPGLSGFVAEVTVFYGSFTSWVAQTGVHAGQVQLGICFAAIGVILTAGYMLWLLKRLFFGKDHPHPNWHLHDATKLETSIALAMSVMIFLMGVVPFIVVNGYSTVADQVIRRVQNPNITMRNVDEAG